MQLSLSQTPKSISSANYLLRQYGGAAAAYSLQRLDTSSENVVRVRESVGDTEADFTAEEVSGGALREFALQNDADLIRFANQSAATDKRMYFDGVDDEVTGVSIPFNVGDTLKFSLTLTSTLKYVVSGPPSFHRIIMSTAAFQITVNGVTSSLGISVSEGRPHDVELVRTSGNVDVYIDGNLEGSVSPADTAVTYTSIGGKSGQASGTGLYRGVIYDVESLTGGVSNALYNGYGNTDADWEDQVGSNDGTVNGSPALFSGQGFDAFVTTWYDQSGNGRNATQATAASQPQIVADGVVVTDANGNAAISFDGVNDWLDHSYNVTVTSQSHFFVSQVESGAAGSSRMYAMAVGTNADVNSADLHIPVIKNSTLEQIAVFDGGYIGASSITYGSPFLWTVLHSGSLISPFLDGSARPTGARTLNAAVTRQFIGAGCNTGTGPFLYMECTMAEMIVYDNANKSADRTAIESNIANRYGITLA